MAEGDCENYICKCHNKNVEKKALKKWFFTELLENQEMIAISLL